MDNPVELSPALGISTLISSWKAVAQHAIPPSNSDSRADKRHRPGGNGARTPTFLIALTNVRERSAEQRP